MTEPTSDRTEPPKTSASDEIEALLGDVGLNELVAASPLIQFEDVLRRLAARLDGASELRERTVRAAVLQRLKFLGFSGGARMFDAALSAHEAETRSERASPSEDDDDPDDDLPVVIVGHDDVVTVDAAEEILAAADPDVYQQRGRLVRIAPARDLKSARLRELFDPEAPIVSPLPLASLREKLSAIAIWKKWAQRGGEPVLVRIDPPQRIAEMLAARGTWTHVRTLRGVIEAPTLLPDGRLIEEPGFDAKSGLYLRPSETFPRVPENPTRQDAIEALERLSDPLRDFPFVRPCHKFAALATMICGVARWSVPGPCPMTFIGSPARGTGKGKLGKTLLSPMTGRVPAMSFAIKSPTETRKSVFALALAGGRYVFVDNVVEPFGDSAWSNILTADSIEDRILQVSERNEASLRGIVFIATGNNPSYVGDAARRILPVDIDAATQDPEDRTGFTYEHLEAHVLSIRPQLVVDCLIVLRAFHLAGSPRHGGPRIGSYEEWDDRIRSALIWAGAEDPALGRTDVREIGDEDVSSTRAVLDAVAAAFPGQPFTAKQIVERSACDEQLRAAFETLCDVESGKLKSLGVGHALKRIRNRVIEGCRIEAVVDAQGRPRLAGGVVQWRLVEVRP